MNAYPCQIERTDGPPEVVHTESQLWLQVVARRSECQSRKTDYRAKRTNLGIALIRMRERTPSALWRHTLEQRAIDKNTAHRSMLAAADHLMLTPEQRAAVCIGTRKGWKSKPEPETLSQHGTESADSGRGAGGADGQLMLAELYGLSRRVSDAMGAAVTRAVEMGKARELARVLTDFAARIESILGAPPSPAAAVFTAAGG